MSEFEIKEAFSVGFGNVSLEEMADVGYSMESAMIKAVAQYALDANDEINRLFAESVSSNQQRLEPDWTPITSVEQVEGLTAGFYELRDIERGVWCPATKKSSGVWQLVIGGAMPVDSTLAASEINDRYREYKLIRAFEPAAPSIPEGAIENTLENRSKAGKGYYLFHFNDGDNLLFYRGDFEFWHYEGEEYIDASPLMDTANYFQQLDADKFNAALEALAKGEL